jgi:hypothetical protein
LIAGLRAASLIPTRVRPALMACMGVGRRRWGASEGGVIVPTKSRPYRLPRNVILDDLINTHGATRGCVSREQTSKPTQAESLNGDLGRWAPHSQRALGASRPNAQASATRPTRAGLTRANQTARRYPHRAPPDHHETNEGGCPILRG